MEDFEIPNWTSSEVVQQLQSLGLRKYGSTFIENSINGEALMFLEDKHLQELGMKTIGHRLTLINFINELKTKKKQTSSKLTTIITNHPEIQKETTPTSKPTSSNWEQKRRQMLLRKMAKTNETPDQNVNTMKPSTKVTYDSDSSEKATISSRKKPHESSQKSSTPYDNETKTMKPKAKRDYDDYGDEKDPFSSRPKLRDSTQKVSTTYDYNFDDIADPFTSRPKLRESVQKPSNTNNNDAKTMKPNSRVTRDFEDEKDAFTSRPKLRESVQKTTNSYDIESKTMKPNSRVTRDYDDNLFDDISDPFTSRPKLRESVQKTPTSYNETKPKLNTRTTRDYEDEKDAFTSRPKLRESVQKTTNTRTTTRTIKDYDDDLYNDNGIDPFASRPKLRDSVQKTSNANSNEQKNSRFTSRITQDYDDDLYDDNGLDPFASRPKLSESTTKTSNLHSNDNQKDAKSSKQYSLNRTQLKTNNSRNKFTYDDEDDSDEELTYTQIRKQANNAQKQQPIKRLYINTKTDSDSSDFDDYKPKSKPPTYGIRKTNYQKEPSDDDDDDNDDDNYDDYVPKTKTITNQKRTIPPKTEFSDDDDDDNYEDFKQNKILNNNQKQDIPNDDIKDLAQCRYCGRKFATDRIAKHETICAKSSKKKTKVFDSRKKRMTEIGAAKYISKVNAEEKKPKKTSSVKKYKIEHEKLVNALRAARGEAVPEQIYEEEDDRVQCPHCGRKFSKEAAPRHISSCERINSRKFRK